MLERLKKQSLSKLLIMAWNVLRMAWLKIRKGKAAKVSLIQNIAPGTTIAVHNGTLRLAHSVFTRKGVTFRASGGETAAVITGSFRKKTSGIQPSSAADCRKAVS